MWNLIMVGDRESLPAHFSRKRQSNKDYLIFMSLSGFYPDFGIS